MNNEVENTTPKRGSGAHGLDLRPSDDFMVLLLSCTLPPRDLELIRTRIRAELADLGITAKARIEEAMERFEKAVPHGPLLDEVVLLEGVPPTPPKDESITWGGNFHAKGFIIDPETGRADYRRKIADVSVKKGQMLAEIVPDAPGKNGKDVFGRMVPAREPRPHPIREGKNIRYDASRRQYFAEKSGQIRYVDNILAVDDVFHVKGDVGLRTGNIDHPGALVIERDIQSDTEVKATGDIDIGENIEDAIVVSGGNITVHGGISCKERGTLKVAGNLHARFIRNADIDADGDIYVDSEINQCNIRTRGAVIVAQGRIVGGSIMALKGIETQDLGSDACIPGEMTVGKDYTMENTVTKLKEELESAKGLVLKLRDAVAPLRSKRDSLMPRMQERLVQLTEELKKREATFQKKEKALKAIFKATRKMAVSHIYVHGTVHPDNLIQVSAQVKKIKETVSGPLRFSLRKGKFSVFKLKDDESLHDRF